MNPLQYDYKSVRDYAKIYNERGLNVLPCKYKSKAPALSQWRQFISRTQSQHCVEQMFSGDRRNVAIVAGPVSQNLVILDFDDYSTYDSLVEKNPTFKNITERTWTVNTPRGRHVYLHTDKPVKSGKAGQVDIKSAGGYCLAPSSLHPGGQLYMFSNENIRPILNISYTDIPFPVEVEDRAEYLRIDAPVQDLGHIILNRRPLYGLSAISRDILVNNALYRYKSRSEAIQRVLTELVGNGYTNEQIHCLFARFAHPGSKYRERGPGWLNLSIDNAVLYVGQHQNEVSKQASVIRANIEQLPIIGSRKHSKRAVISAIAEIMQRTGKTDLYLGQRELAERAGLSTMTVNYVLKEINLPIIEPANGNTPARYYLKDFYATMIHTITKAVSVSMYKKCIKLNEDVFRRYGLNKTGVLVVNWINHHINQDFQVKDIVTDVDVHQSTISRVLDRLFSADVISRQGRIYHCQKTIDTNALQKAAEVLGTAGSLARQQERHRRERNEFKKSYDEWRLKAG